MNTKLILLSILLISSVICHNPGEYDPNKEPNRPWCNSFTDELLDHYGYPNEIHKIHTSDGYINTFYRF